MADHEVLNEVRDAAEAVVEARANDGDAEVAARRALDAARAALDGGAAISAIAAAEAEGERAARDRLGGQVLRVVERSAKKLRDVTSEYERAIAQAVQLGLPARDIAARAGVSHGTVAAVARRHEQVKPAPPNRPAHESGEDVASAEPASRTEAGSPDVAGPPAVG